MGGRSARALLPALLCLLVCACSRPVATPSSGSPAPAAARSATPSSAPSSAGAAAVASGSQAPVVTSEASPIATPAGALLQAGGDNPPTVNLRTADFNASGSWDLAWSYDCSRLGRDGNLGLDVYRTDGSYISLPPSINQIGRGGQGTQQYAQGGGFYLTVNSVCRWSLTVTASARPTSTPGPASQAGPSLPVTAPAASAPAANPTLQPPAGAISTPSP